MTIQEYQEQVKRTDAEMDSPLMGNLHMVLGMQTETAEIADVFKKHIAYGKDLDMINIKEELGDLMWYVANICNKNGWDLRNIMNTNIEKLKTRFPENFSMEKALNRDLESERKILEL